MTRFEPIIYKTPGKHGLRLLRTTGYARIALLALPILSLVSVCHAFVYPEAFVATEDQSTSQLRHTLTIAVVERVEAQNAKKMARLGEKRAVSERDSAFGQIKDVQATLSETETALSRLQGQMSDTKNELDMLKKDVSRLTKENLRLQENKKQVEEKEEGSE